MCFSGMFRYGLAKTLGPSLSSLWDKMGQVCFFLRRCQSGTWEWGLHLGAPSLTQFWDKFPDNIVTFPLPDWNYAVCFLIILLKLWANQILAKINPKLVYKLRIKVSCVGSSYCTYHVILRRYSRSERQVVGTLSHINVDTRCEPLTASSFGRERFLRLTLCGQRLRDGKPFRPIQKSSQTPWLRCWFFIMDTW